MVAYATAPDLAVYLKIPLASLNVDNANKVIAGASGAFSQVASIWWEQQSTTWQEAGCGARRLVLPFDPVNSVAAVRVAGVTLVLNTDYTWIKRVLYSAAGFGSAWSFPPDLVEVDLSYGFSTVPDDVQLAILESAGRSYLHPDVAISLDRAGPFETRYAPNLLQKLLSPGAYDLAVTYSGPLVA